MLRATGSPQILLVRTRLLNLTTSILPLTTITMIFVGSHHKVLSIHNIYK